MQQIHHILRDWNDAVARYDRRELHHANRQLDRWLAEEQRESRRALQSERRERRAHRRHGHYVERDDVVRARRHLAELERISYGLSALPRGGDFDPIVQRQKRRLLSELVQLTTRSLRAYYDEAPAQHHGGWRRRHG